MGRKPKAGGADGKRTDPAQSSRFLEAAREAGVDETGEAFERAFDRIAHPGRAQAPPEKKRPPEKRARTRK
jgi:hypothetical protein